MPVWPSPCRPPRAWGSLVRGGTLIFYSHRQGWKPPHNPWRSVRLNSDGTREAKQKGGKEEPDREPQLRTASRQSSRLLHHRARSQDFALGLFCENSVRVRVFRAGPSSSPKASLALPRSAESGSAVSVVAGGLSRGKSAKYGDSFVSASICSGAFAREPQRSTSRETFGQLALTSNPASLSIVVFG
jgi:hypothetical protein